MSNIKVTVTVEYGERVISTTRRGDSGNPLFAPRVVRNVGVEALGDALDMLRGVTGDIDAPSPG